MNCRCWPSGMPAATINLYCEVDAEQVGQADGRKAASPPCGRRLPSALGINDAAENALRERSRNIDTV